MIGYLFPDKLTKQILDKNSEIIFIDEKGFWARSKNHPTRILLSKIDSINNLKFFDSIKARKYLNWYMPLWTRWVAHAEQYENKKERSIDKIYDIFSMLKSYNINGVIFNTSVAHHLDSTFLSIACRLNNIDQIYLYAVVLNGRLLPFLQSSNVESRRRLNLDLSKFIYEKVIEKFIRAKENNSVIFESDQVSLPPRFKKSNNLIFYFINKYFKNWNRNLFFTLLFLIRRQIFNIFKLNKHNYLHSNNLIPLHIEKYSTIEDIRQINTHRLFLKKLSTEIISENEIKNFRSQKKIFLIIAAHYQPEATTFPEGDKYYNHIDIARVLRKKNYTSKILYKEHPSIKKYIDKYSGLTKIGINRSVDYIKILKKLDCVFLPNSFNLSIINDNDWYVPVTITGSIAIERSLSGLHTIYTGNAWFKGLPGTIFIEDMDSLDEIPVKWAKKDETIKTEAMIFMKKILNNKTIANLPGISSGVPEDTDEDIKDFEEGIFKIIEWFKNKKNKLIF